ncbi:hypothetical protein MJH12_12550 [bacterium]|nr:hypothetical protein [bacterium]
MKKRTFYDSSTKKRMVKKYLSQSDLNIVGFSKQESISASTFTRIPTVIRYFKGPV